MIAKFPVTTGLGVDLLDCCSGEFIWRHPFGNIGPIVLVPLQVGSIFAHSQHRVTAIDRKRGQRAGINISHLVDERPQPIKANTGITPIEPLQRCQPGIVTVGDCVQRLFHPSGEVVVHKIGKVVLQQPDHGHA